MKFAYRAFDLSGREKRDVVEAATLGEAEEIIRKGGLFIAEIAARGAADTDAGAPEAVAGSSGRRFTLGGRGKTARLRDVSTFLRQLSVLVATGTPMVDAVTALERQLSDGEWKIVVGDVRKAIEEGRQLSEAMVRHPRYFDPVCRSLVAAGESGGQLDAMLRRLSMLVRQSLKIRSNLIGAMVYPTLLIFVSLGVMGAMFGFVLPRFEGLFKTLETPLPPTTKLMMEISAVARDYWWAILGGLIAFVGGAKFYLATPAGRRWAHATVLRLPQVGRVLRALATARIARVMGVLLEGKVPMLETLQLTREATGNLCYRDLIADAEDRVVRGENISSAFASSRLVPQSVTEAVRSGEKTGQLAAVLTSIADYLDEDNEVIIRSLTSIVEPLILLTLGVVVGFVAISMFLPLFDLTSSTGPQGAGGGG